MRWMLSFTACSGRPTRTVFGRADGETSTSTSTGRASIPRSEKVWSLASMGHSVARASGSSLGVLGILAGRRVGLICRVETFVADGIFGDRSLLLAAKDVLCRQRCFSRHIAEVIAGAVVRGE